MMSVLADFFLAGFDADDHAGDLVGRIDLDPLAANLLQELGQRGIGRQVDGEALSVLVIGSSSRR